MNCECFYVVKDNSFEAARELAKEIDRVAERQEEEVYPVCISRAIKDFYATSDYDNWGTTFKIKDGTWLVFAQGKDYCMNRIRPKGGRRGFPDQFRSEKFWEDMYEYIEDVEEVCDNWILRQINQEKSK